MNYFNHTKKQNNDQGAKCPPKVVGEIKRGKVKGGEVKTGMKYYHQYNGQSPAPIKPILAGSGFCYDCASHSLLAPDCRSPPLHV